MTLKTSTNTKEHIVQVKFPRGLADRLSEQAEEEMLTRSSLIRRLAAEYLKGKQGVKGHASTKQ